MWPTVPQVHARFTAATGPRHCHGLLEARLLVRPTAQQGRRLPSCRGCRHAEDVDMIDVKVIRANPDALRAAVRDRGVSPERADVDRWLQLDEERRTTQRELDGLNTEKKELARLGRTDPEAARHRGQELREQGRVLEQRQADITAAWQQVLDWFPNWPHPDMPRGTGEDDNVEERAWIPGIGYLPAERLGRGNNSAAFMPARPVHATDLDFPLLDHADLGATVGIDTAQGAKVSGSRFAYVFGAAARLQYALTRLLCDELLHRGYQMMIPPLLVRERSLYGTSHFPEGRDQVYAIGAENVEENVQLFLVGSSEPTNFSYFMDRMVPQDELPVRLFAVTTCFRSEAGSWGRDVKGIKRVHQFDKLEMNAVCHPDQSTAMYEEFGQINEWLLQSLELPYRVIDKCTGDAGYLAAHRQRDMEVWMPATGAFMEVMTDTNTTDYQARRMGIRFRCAKGGPQFCHTVNDTGCAMGRMLIAILENYQQPGGAVRVPQVLRAVVGADRLEPAPQGK
jgi:seryl-tRNA synthetase